MNNKQNYLITLSLTIILTFILSACNSGETQTVVTPDEVSVRLPWVHKVDFSGYYVADQEGYYEDENLVVTINPIDFEVDPVEQVLSGEDDFGEIPGTTLLEARAAGKPVVALAMIYRRNVDVFISLAENEITSVEDFVGKKVGVTVGQEFAYDFLLSAAEVDPSEIERIENTEFTMRPLLEGEVDVLSGYATDQPVTAQLDNIELNIVSAGDYGVSVPGHVLFTSEDMVENHPDIVERFVRSTLKGIETVVENPGQGVEATLSVDETLNADFQTEVLEQLRPYIVPDDGNAIGYMDEQTWQEGADALLEQGRISDSIDPKEAYTTEFLPETQ